MKKVGNKVVVVGLGAVGVSYAYSMLNQALCDDMVLIDINRTRAEGEARDFRHGMPYAAIGNRFGNSQLLPIFCIRIKRLGQSVRQTAACAAASGQNAGGSQNRQ